MTNSWQLFKLSYTAKWNYTVSIQVHSPTKDTNFKKMCEWIKNVFFIGFSSKVKGNIGARFKWVSSTCYKNCNMPTYWLMQLASWLITATFHCQSWWCPRGLHFSIKAKHEASQIVYFKQVLLSLQYSWHSKHFHAYGHRGGPPNILAR